MSVFSHPDFSGYQLVDSGNGEKLERFGKFFLRRPDPQALWRPQFTPERWESADACFIRESDRGGRWRGSVPKVWSVDLSNNVSVCIKPTPFKHVGLFPEQATNWKFIRRQGEVLLAGNIKEPKLLNLFGYTGASSLLAASSGWSVTHCDASKLAIDWAAENAKLSSLEGRVRWILDDAVKFALREQRRGQKYHGILLDPPHYGRGPKGEKWQFEKGIAPLLQACEKLLSFSPGSFLILSTYAIGYSSLAFKNILREASFANLHTGELALPEEVDGRLLPCGICMRAVRG